MRRHHSGTRIAGAAIGGPFWILIKVSLALFVVLVVGPFWILYKLAVAIAGAAVERDISTGVKRQAATILDQDANRRALRDVERANPWLTDPSIPRPSQRRSQGQQGWSQASVSNRR